MKTAPRALILSGDGINCEIETAEAARAVGFEAEICHINDLLDRAKEKINPFSSYALFVVPGGFSFGDELGSGKILALKLKHGVGVALQEWISEGGLVLGICNGFQVLVRLELFGKELVLAANSHGHFLNRWVGMGITGSSVFTDHLKKDGVTSLELPMRHGEGRLVFTDSSLGPRMFEGSQCVLQYHEDVNGSWNKVAGLSSFDGRVFGLMPHPEAFWSPEFHPSRSEAELRTARIPLGLEIFRGAFLHST